MVAEDLDFSQFENLAALQHYIDAHDEELCEYMESSEFYLKYKNLRATEEEKKDIQIELDCCYADVQSDRIHFLAASHGKTGLETSVYPDLELFNDSVVKYLSRRAKETTSLILIARYYHLLWKAPVGRKDKQNALAAISAYESLIRQYLVGYGTTSDDGQAAKIGPNMELLLGLASELNDYFAEVKLLMQDLLFGEVVLPFFCKHGLSDDMMKYPKIFKATDFENILAFYEVEMQSADTLSQFHYLADYYLPLATRIAQKTGSDVRKWHRFKGEAFEKMAEGDRNSDGQWLNQKYLAEAIHAYSLAGDDERKRQAQQKYAALKPQTSLSEFTIEPDEETLRVHAAWTKEIREQSEKVLSGSATKIYEHLANDPMFPSEEQLSKNAKKNPFMELGMTVRFDRNKNVAATDDGKNELYYVMYQYLIRQKTVAMLHNIILPGVEKGLLNARNLLEYLACSWMGQPILYADLGGKEREMNILGLVAPALTEFFAQLHAWHSSKYAHPSFILCMDSLTLKIESIMRYFGQLVKINTSVGRKKAIQEMYIHEILDEKAFQQLFSKDDLIFFKYLFVSNTGMNLRNNIAHGFYEVEEYSYDKMLLLIAALLRIAKFKVKAIQK